MSPLQFLRQSKHIARWVLMWFALSVTVAVAAPVLNPQTLTLVCTAAGQVKLVSAASTGNTAAVSSDASGTSGVAADLHKHLDCVLCLALNAPPLPDAGFALQAPDGADKPVMAAGFLVPRARALTLSARGPPALAGLASPL